MEPEELLNKMLKQCSASCKSVEDEIAMVTRSLQKKEEELSEVQAQTDVVRTENKKIQMLLDEAQNLVATVPELKEEIAKLKKREEACKAELAEKNKKLLDMRIKNFEWKAAEEERIAAKQSLEKQEERKRMELCKALLEKIHEENMARLIQAGEKERQEIEEQKMRLLVEGEKMLVEQIDAAKQKTHSGPSEMDGWRQNYEEELREKVSEVSELAALKQEENNNEGGEEVIKEENNKDEEEEVISISDSQENEICDEGDNRNALEKPNMRLDKEEEEFLADSSNSTQALDPELNDVDCEVVRQEVDPVQVNDLQFAKKDVKSKEMEEQNVCESGVVTTVSQENQEKGLLKTFEA